jgi:hypothetical protein
MAVLAREPVLARATVDRLHELGTRGRATEAGRNAVLAGIAAMEGDKAAALAGFRQSINALNELATPYDAALATMVAISCLGAGEPETLGWATRAADFFEAVGATPLALQLGRLVEQAGGSSQATSSEAGRAQSTKAPATG